MISPKFLTILASSGKQEKRKGLTYTWKEWVCIRKNPLPRALGRFTISRALKAWWILAFFIQQILTEHLLNAKHGRQNKQWITISCSWPWGAYRIIWVWSHNSREIHWVDGTGTPSFIIQSFLRNSGIGFVRNGKTGLQRQLQAEITSNNLSDLQFLHLQMKGMG